MQQSYQKIKSAGLGLEAISYDSPAVLKNFAERKKIQFPLLSDSGSNIIRRFGILNAEPVKGSMSYGIPYPGIYVLDAKGVVTAKYFEDDYKERDTAAVILMKEFGLRPDESPTPVNAKHLQLGTSISDREAYAGQHLALILDVKLGDRVHVYAPGVRGYIPIAWELAPSAGVKFGPAKYPESKILRLEAIQESVPVYEGEFRLVREVTIGNDQAVAPPLEATSLSPEHSSIRLATTKSASCRKPYPFIGQYAFGRLTAREFRKRYREENVSRPSEIFHKAEQIPEIGEHTIARR